MQKEVGKKIDEKLYQKFSWHMNFINTELDRKMKRKIESFIYQFFNTIICE